MVETENTRQYISDTEYVKGLLTKTMRLYNGGIIRQEKTSLRTCGDCMFSYPGDLKCGAKFVCDVSPGTVWRKVW